MVPNACDMGLLSKGSPLNWEETKKYADHVRKHGIVQFLNIYNKVKERQKDVLLWGDEVRLPWLNVYLNVFFALHVISVMSVSECALSSVKLQLC